MSTVEERLELVESKLEVAINAIHLLTVSANPTSKWLDAKIAEVDRGAKP